LRKKEEHNTAKQFSEFLISHSSAQSEQIIYPFCVVVIGKGDGAQTVKIIKREREWIEQSVNPPIRISVDGQTIKTAMQST